MIIEGFDGRPYAEVILDGEVQRYLLDSGASFRKDVRHF